MSRADADRLREERARYREGKLDGLNDLPPAWLGIDWYRSGYEAGRRAADHPEGATLLSEERNDDRLARVYAFEGHVVAVYFSFRDLEWVAWVPGYGGHPALDVRGAILNLPRSWRFAAEAA